MFHWTQENIREPNADTDPDELRRKIDEPVGVVRAERLPKTLAEKG